MNDYLYLCFCLLLAISISGCTTTQIEGAIIINQSLTSHDGIVLLSDLVDSSAEYSDKDVDKCLGKWMREVNPKIKFIDAKEFREQLYPYFSASTVPKTIAEYQSVLKKHPVLERIKALNVRYLIVQSGKTNQEYHGGIGFLGGGAVGGFFGLLTWNRHTDFNAQIWDLKTGEEKGKIKVQASGKGVLPAIGLPIPLYLPATEKASCKELANHIVSALPKD